MSGSASTVVAVPAVVEYDPLEDYSSPDNQPTRAHREPETLHERLGQTRAHRYAAHWDADDAWTDARDRRITHRAIGNISKEDADAKDRRLLHYLESNLDGRRRQSCTASVRTIAARTDLSVANVERRLRALVARGRVRSKEYADGRVGYVVVVSHEEHERAAAELRALWKRRPEYSGWLTDEDEGPDIPARCWDEIRLWWTRDLWRSSLPGFVKGVGLEITQWVDRTGDAPFARLTVRVLAERTGYSPRQVQEAISVLRWGGHVHVTSHLGRGDRGGGLDIRLRLADSEARWREYRPAVGIVPDSAQQELHTKTLQTVANEAAHTRIPSLQITRTLDKTGLSSPVYPFKEGVSDADDENTTSSSVLVCKKQRISEHCAHCEGRGIVWQSDVEWVGWRPCPACGDR